jgi:hypothetical protein
MEYILLIINICISTLLGLILLVCITNVVIAVVLYLKNTFDFMDRLINSYVDGIYASIIIITIKFLLIMLWVFFIYQHLEIFEMCYFLWVHEYLGPYNTQSDLIVQIRSFYVILLGLTIITLLIKILLHLLRKLFTNISDLFIMTNNI